MRLHHVDGGLYGPGRMFGSSPPRQPDTPVTHPMTLGNTSVIFIQGEQMTKAITADLHMHNWQSFAQIDASNGMNTRLQALLKGLIETAKALKDRDGKVLYVAGDLFHVRGKIAPSVLNPVLATFKAIIAMGIEVRIIPGNHDLEGKDSHTIGNAVAALSGIGCVICEKVRVFDDDKTVVVPWYDSLDELRDTIKSVAKQLVPEVRAEFDLILHAPVNGVIAGLPDHGLTGEELASYGFKRVFSGHYHNHKEVVPGVYSIGALAHHTWSDVGSIAGYIIADDKKVEQFETSLPKFVDLPDDISVEELYQIVNGNFVRIKVKKASVTELNAIREELTRIGAKGVVIQPIKEATVKREAAVSATVKSGASVEVSVSEFVKARFNDKADQIDLAAQRILAQASMEVEQ
jgi:DNA repair exonuclease SbcCD nuclease subunit